MIESQEPRTKSQDQVDLTDVKEHMDMVENVVHALRNLHADLLPHNLNYARNEGRRFIEIRLKYLNTDETARNYLQTFGPFYRLFNYLKARYEAEVVNSELSTPNS